jgi:hypothetical protein
MAAASVRHMSGCSLSLALCILLDDNNVNDPFRRVALQLDAERAAQDREDEEIQQRLQQQREAAKADAAARSVSPPVYNRPMSPPPGSAPRTPLPPPGVEPPEFRVSAKGADVQCCRPLPHSSAMQSSAHTLHDRIFVLSV